VDAFVPNRRQSAASVPGHASRGFPRAAIVARRGGEGAKALSTPYSAYPSALALMESNSACVMAPESSRPFAFSISAAAPPLLATERT
jgi:hypothetical protein